MLIAYTQVERYGSGTGADTGVGTNESAPSSYMPVTTSTFTRNLDYAPFTMTWSTSRTTTVVGFYPAIASATLKALWETDMSLSGVNSLGIEFRRPGTYLITDAAGTNSTTVSAFAANGFQAFVCSATYNNATGVSVLYVNGVQVATQTGTPPLTDSPFWVLGDNGRGTHAQSSAYQGVINHSYILPVNDITNLHNALLYALRAITPSFPSIT